MGQDKWPLKPDVSKHGCFGAQNEANQFSTGNREAQTHEQTQLMLGELF